MMNSFSSLGISAHAHRVSATSISDVKSLLERGQLTFHERIRFEEMSNHPPSWEKHMNGRYHFVEAACLHSHLNAIRQAYKSGHKMALIVEDDAMITSRFRDSWFDYVDKAPKGWKILQLATVNLPLAKHGSLLRDPFISWHTHSWSTRAYIINRAGMESLMEKVHSNSLLDQSVWHITHVPTVVADEAIYAVTGDVYLATGLWIDSNDLSRKSSVQGESFGEDPHLMLSYSPSIVGDEYLQNGIKSSDQMFGQSLLVLINVRLFSEEGVKAIEWIREDYHALCKFHSTCEWHVNLLVQSYSMMGFISLLTSGFPINIHVQITLSQPWSEILFLHNCTSIMREYDLVLLKNHVQRISGFPWRTFMEKRKNAVVSGPLTANVNEHLICNMRIRRPKYFEFYEASGWVNNYPKTEHTRNTFANIVPVSVPMLDTYFVLLDAEFAYFFFNKILSNRQSELGPEFLWCQAAKEWDQARPSCYLIPITSRKEDSQMNYFRDHSPRSQLSHLYVNDPVLERWMAPALKWGNEISFKSISAIEKYCDVMVSEGGTADSVLDFQQCKKNR